MEVQGQILPSLSLVQDDGIGFKERTYSYYFAFTGLAVNTGPITRCGGGFLIDAGATSFDSTGKPNTPPDAFRAASVLPDFFERLTSVVVSWPLIGPTAS